jgi:hypothetical protein
VRDERVWEVVFIRYRGVVRAWRMRHPAWHAVEDDADDWTSRSFKRIWSAITPEPFTSVSSLAALLRYLKLCRHSVLLDEYRRHVGRCEPLGEARLITDEQDPERAVVVSNGKR